MLLLALVGGILIGLILSTSINEKRNKKLKNAFKELIHSMEHAKQLNHDLQETHNRERELWRNAPSIQEMMKPENIELMRITTMQELDRITRG